MELTVLGCSGSYGAPAGGACSGYLVRAGDAVIWMDCGNGSFANLQQHVDPGRAHRGRHHARAPRPLRRPLRPARDEQVRPRARRAFRCTRPKASRSSSRVSSASGRDTFDWRLVGDGDRLDLDGVALRFSRTDHPPPTVAVEIAHDGKRLVYTADTGPEWSVDGVRCRRRSRALGGDVPARRHPCADPPLGPPGRRGGARGEARRLMLTHLWPTHRPDSLRRRRARRHSATRSSLAAPHLVHPHLIDPRPTESRDP